MATLVITGLPEVVEEYSKLMTTLLPYWKIVPFGNPEDPPQEASTAKLVLATHGSIPAFFKMLPAIEFVQISFTGFDWFDFTLLPEHKDDSLPLVCNMREHETAIAEYVMLQILEWHLKMARMNLQFRKDGFQCNEPAFHCHREARHGEIRGLTLGLIGMGAIAGAIAPRAAAFGMNVIAVSRRACSPPPAHVAWQGSTGIGDDWHRFLTEADVIVICCPADASTRGLINKASLGMMKSDALLINVARGSIIVEDDLFDCLQAKHIGGAVLDVWWQYPKQHPAEIERGSRAPFHLLGNCVVSPHCSGYTAATSARRIQGCADNLQRFHENRTHELRHVVPRSRWNKEPFESVNAFNS
eukprot:TRINITY_DN10455_c0_g1_i1.p2 TRINITY_DN10455_c0_g1~~TRINITY_DN10455_c0_g1_i1.p2  ORF type:complete len:357 (+),score=44.15 TRINITY_DN10455_c0_g1_i1:1666-2736(+)